MNGTSAESANDNDFQTADLKSTSAENGRQTAEDVPTHADPADPCRPPKTNGSQESLDNQQNCRYADLADHLITDEKITSDDEEASLTALLASETPPDNVEDADRAGWGY
jgi:hypothetical protein